MKEPGKLPPFDPETGELNVIIETPRGSHNKYAYDEQLGLIRFKKLLPAGMFFPFDFGFVPSTRSGDGDPLDVLVIAMSLCFPAAWSGEGCSARSKANSIIAENGKAIIGSWSFPCWKSGRRNTVPSATRRQTGPRTRDFFHFQP